MLRTLQSRSGSIVMAETNELVDLKAFQQEESNSDQLLQGLEPSLNLSRSSLVVLVLIC